MNKYKLIESLEKHEGKRSLPYYDSEGFLTIGIGHKLDSIPLSDKAIYQILQDDIDYKVGELHAGIPYWHEGLNHDRQNVIIEMAFNLGVAGLKKFKKMWAAIKEEDFQTAAEEMLASKWHEQVGKRAETLAKIMREGE